MKFLQLLTFLSMAMIVSHAAAAAVAPETYWQLVLPNTPMPRSLIQLLNNDKSIDILGKDFSVVGGGGGGGSSNQLLYPNYATKDDVVGGGGGGSSNQLLYPNYAAKDDVVGGGGGGSSNQLFYPRYATKDDVGGGGSSNQLFYPKYATKDDVVGGGGGSSNQLFYPKYAAKDGQPKHNPKNVVFFLENDMKSQGKRMNLQLAKTTTPSATFLPRGVADTIPFSSKKLPEVYARFSIKPDTVGSKTMKQTLIDCEDEGLEGEEKYCATSLEAMVDFTTSMLGNEVRAISTEVRETKRTPLQMYTIQGVETLADTGVVCHTLNYPYSVFYCHKTDTTTLVYTVSLVGEDGTKAKAVAICHTDTSKWSPNHMSFRVLKVKPGTTSICHFLPVGDVVWVPYNTSPHGLNLPSK